MQEEGEGQGPQPGARGGAAQARAKVRERQGPPRGCSQGRSPGSESPRGSGALEKQEPGEEKGSPHTIDGNPEKEERQDMSRGREKRGTGLATSNGPKTWFC